MKLVEKAPRVRTLRGFFDKLKRAAKQMFCSALIFLEFFI